MNVGDPCALFCCWCSVGFVRFSVYKTMRVCNWSRALVEGIGISSGRKSLLRCIVDVPRQLCLNTSRHCCGHGHRP